MQTMWYIGISVPPMYSGTAAGFPCLISDSPVFWMKADIILRLIFPISRISCYTFATPLIPEKKREKNPGAKSWISAQDKPSF